MKTATVTEAKNGLSALLDRVRAGESVLILDRGRPVARLEPAVSIDDPAGRLARLERAGVVSVGGAAPPLELLRRRGPKLTPGPGVVDALLEERRDSR